MLCGPRLRAKFVDDRTLSMWIHAERNRPRSNSPAKPTVLSQVHRGHDKGYNQANRVNPI